MILKVKMKMHITSKEVLISFGKFREIFILLPRMFIAIAVAVDRNDQKISYFSWRSNPIK